MTQKLYLDDSYLKECEAEIVKAEGKFVELDKTIFYPQGGGQPSDTGKIFRGKDEFKVVSAKNSEGKVLHETDKEGLKVGDTVKCVLDWEQRYKYMRMHTSAHIMAQIVLKELGALITGNQLGLEETRMDFSVPEFDKELLKSFEGKANEIIEKNLPITVSYEERETALKRPELFRLKDVLPKNIPILRIVAIGDFDIQADGGTHVKTTKEIGKIRITDFKNKGAENRRIYWKLE